MDAHEDGKKRKHSDESRRTKEPVKPVVDAESFEPFHDEEEALEDSLDIVDAPFDPAIRDETEEGEV